MRLLPQSLRLTLLALLLTLAAGLRAHANWRPNSLEIGIAGDRLWIELRVDLPAMMLGVTPEAAEEVAMERFMTDDARLAAALAAMHLSLPPMVTVEVDGRQLPLRLVERPVLDDFRPLPRDDQGKMIHPVVALARFDTRAPAGRTECRVRLDPSLGPVVARLRLGPDRMEFVSMGAGEWSATLPFEGPHRPAYATALDFARRGFGHVVPDGWDHALFMLTLLLGAATFRGAIGRSLAFTLGHATSLGLVWSGLLRFPGAWVEAAIAASITAGAALALVRHGRLASLGWLLALAFGLLHGLGFAAAAPVPWEGGAGFAAAMLGFNLGIEAAQLMLLVLVWAALDASRDRPWHETRVRRPLALLAALAGAALFVARVG